MPKVSAYLLLWLPEQGCYELREQGNSLWLDLADEPWQAWLAAHSSFAFQGKLGNLTLLKEGRARGEEGYWYAYRSRGGRTRKRYLGRSQHLTLARLEEVAGALATQADQSSREQGTGTVNSWSQDRPAMPSLPLLAPKLRVPPLRTSLVARERLLAQVDAGIEQKLTLICAPAGFGKTTLVSQWIVERRGRARETPIAWVALDAGDNDPERFWRYVITACRPLLRDGGRAALTHLQATPQLVLEPASLETTLTIFLNKLAQNDQPGVLVLEDYHVITEPRLHETLVFLLEHLPSTLRLVMLARGDPALPLARLRARGELSEIRTADLRFSRREMELFLQQALTVPLAGEVVTQLTVRLEGWAAGLRLVALALQRQVTPQEIEHFLTSLAGSQRSLLAYFVSEVLNVQAQPIQDFLLQTSALRRLTGSLCDAMTGRNDSAEVLETLTRANLFLEPLDEMGQWYRYHALFAESMQHEARRRWGEEYQCALAGKASRWYEQEDLLADAVEAALQARDAERAAGLIEQNYASAMQQENISEFHTLYSWMQQLPEETLRRHPILCLNYATLVTFVAPPGPLTPEVFARFEGLVQITEARAHAQENMSWYGSALALRALIAWRQEKATLAKDYAHQALARLPAEEVVWRGTGLSVIARVELLAGQFDASRQKLQEALAFCQAVGNHTFTRAMMGMLSGVCTEQGALSQAAVYLRQMLAEARERADLDDIGYGQLGMAQLLYAWNNLDAAHHAAQEVVAVGEQLAHAEHLGNAALMLARIEHAQGHHVAAQQRLEALLASPQPRGSAQMYRQALVYQARFQLAAGHLVAVEQWARARPVLEPMLPFAQREREVLLVARLEIARGAIDEALTRLTRLLSEAQEARRMRSTLEIQVLLALSYHQCLQTERARDILREALTLARPEGYVRLFLDEGATMLSLLRAVLAGTREKALIAYIRSILQAFTREPGSESSLTSPDLLNEPLSAQESQVLRLLVAGHSNPAIARELVVSVNTIRTQVQSIYRKLNVHNRVAASEMARELRLL